MVPLDTTDIAGPVGWYQSSPTLRRGFCTQCGTTLFSERASGNVIGLTMGSLDEPDRFTPEAQIWTASKQAWVPLCADIAAYPAAPPG